MAIVTTAALGLAIYIAIFSGKGADFPVFYHAACIILDPDVPNEMVYNLANYSNYPIPESTDSVTYAYSMAAAYVMSPLALMPYFTAKTLFIFMDIVAYLTALAIVIRHLRIDSRLTVYILSLSLCWVPFIIDIFFGQLNSTIFLLIVLASYYATEQKPNWAGVLLGIAALFKLFPFAIAMVMGLKNWRIFAACLGVIAVSFMIPGSFHWIPSLAGISPLGSSEIYSYLNQYGLYWFWAYATVVGLITALIVGRSKNLDYFGSISIAIPAIFITMPVIEFYHLTSLVLTCLCLLVAIRNEKWFVAILVACMAVFYLFAEAVHVNTAVLIAIFALWILSMVGFQRGYRQDLAGR